MHYIYICYKVCRDVLWNLFCNKTDHHLTLTLYPPFHPFHSAPSPDTPSTSSADRFGAVRLLCHWSMIVLTHILNTITYLLWTRSRVITSQTAHGGHHQEGMLPYITTSADITTDITAAYHQPQGISCRRKTRVIIILPIPSSACSLRLSLWLSVAKLDTIT